MLAKGFQLFSSVFLVFHVGQRFSVVFEIGQLFSVVSFPSGLQNLTFGENFNQNLANVNFPSGLHRQYGILLASIAMSFCESHGECLGYSETAHPGWNQLYPGGWLVGGGELLPSDDWVSCVKGQAASFYAGTLSVVGFQGSCGSLNGLYNYHQGTTFHGSPYFNSGSRILYYDPYCNGDGVYIGTLRSICFIIGADGQMVYGAP